MRMSLEDGAAAQLSAAVRRKHTDRGTLGGEGKMEQLFCSGFFRETKISLSSSPLFGFFFTLTLTNGHVLTIEF